MKKLTKLFWLIALVLSSFAGYGQSVDQLDTDNGMGDVKFGTSLRNDARFTLYEIEGVIKLYKRDNEEADISYLSSDNKLFMIGIVVTNREDSKALLTALVNRYGLPQQEDDARPEYCWHGEHVVMTFFIDASNGRVVVKIVNTDIIRELQGDNNKYPRT